MTENGSDMSTKKHQMIVIGAGPGGYVAAIRAAQLGLDVAIVDKNKVMGGTCLRVGCIPSKALLESSEKYEEIKKQIGVHGINVKGVSLDLGKMLKRKDKIVQGLTKGIEALLKKNKITRYEGNAKFTKDRTVIVESGGVQVEELEADNIIIATGSRSATIAGVELDSERVDTSTEALNYKEVPKHLAVIGGGYIGIELGSVWRRLGAEVTIVEYLDRILPGIDSEVAKEAHKLLEKQGMKFELRSRVQGANIENNKITIERRNGDPIEADRVLVAVGRAPFTANLGLEDVGVKRDDRGWIIVDDDYKTNIEGVYAIGDVIPGPMLAHKAEEEGMACVEKIVTGFGHVNYKAIPAVVYTHPEIAAVGKTEDELKDEAVEYRKGKFPFIANGRAKAIEYAEGFVKILTHAKTDRVLGVHIIGPHAGDLIAECTAAMEFGASAEDIARTCHAHPTLSEAVKEAALAVEDRAIHM
ncbi:Dihydrolipoyl dehydrogenase [Poriferisphaera corsica]|uniref:Dihydrolipoyl dehydrogenase n=1 Tax=Poriferisphaera corsica TaxID=2528020 RepID=A0A517YXG1_9BACT|nr:dihydrolipoyl dehydrogenase [Poriferisphaera corsica]QDU34915.1 Dihydrolipoyl dehydrogenase [Poriferisphaera corsica]